MENRKIVILGAGHVGTHCALSLMFRALANEIVLIDTDEEKAKSQVLDLDDMGACIRAKVVIRSGNYDDLCDADILVNAIGRSRKEGETRLDMFEDSIERLKDIIPKIIEAQSAEVDTISGATFSSTGIKNAAEQALEQAVK